MTKTSSRLLLLAGLLGATAAAPAFASGSYSGRPPKPPAQSGGDMKMKMDREKYGLGQKIYEGGARLTGGGDASAQMARLKNVQAQLPPDASKMKDLVGLAGKLSAAELDALEYYVKERFPMMAK
ncbi:MAG: hypothetical protein ABIZ81_15975 [Opitutaceae bacterium]